MKRLGLAGLIAGLLLSGCFPDPKPTPTPTPTAEPSVTATPTPSPTPIPVLARVNGKLGFHYYNDCNERYGCDDEAMRLRTSARLDRFGAVKNASDPGETDEVLTQRMASVLDRIPRGMPIVMALDYRWASTASDGGARAVESIYRMVRDRGRWGDVYAIEVYDEPDGGAQEVQGDCEDVDAIATSLGLPLKPLGLTSTPEGILGRVAALKGLRGLRGAEDSIVATASDYVVGDSMLRSRVPVGMMRTRRPASARRGLIVSSSLPGYGAPKIRWVALELYAPLQLAWALDEVVSGWPLVSISDQIATVRALRPDMMFAAVIQGYGRNYDSLDRLGWRNMHTLVLLNRQSFVAILDRPEVLWAGIFSCGRETCTCDQKNPQVGVALRPVHSAARARIDNPTAPWPALPTNPLPTYPARIEPTRIDVKGKLGDSAEVSAPRRWGHVVLVNLRVWGPTGVEYDRPIEFLGKNVVTWTTTVGSVSAQHANETYGWGAAVEFGDAPVGAEVVITATLKAKGRVVTWSKNLGRIEAAGYIRYGKCDVGNHQRVAIWVSNVTGRSRCANHGGIWPQGE